MALLALCVYSASMRGDIGFLFWLALAATHASACLTRRWQRELAGGGALAVAALHRALGRLALPPPRPAGCALLGLPTWRAPAAAAAPAVWCGRLLLCGHAQA